MTMLPHWSLLAEIFMTKIKYGRWNIKRLLAGWTENITTEMNQTYNYMGITGISDRAELMAVVERCGSLSLPTGYFLNIGILLSHQTFSGCEPRIGKYPQKHEAYELLKSIPPSWKAIIHYNTNVEISLSEQVSAILSHKSVYDNNICRAIQLNVKSPNQLELKRIRSMFPDLSIVLQVPLWRDDLASLESMLRFLLPYADTATHFLFDPSGGRGTGLSSDCLQLISAASHKFPEHIGIAVAGGLCGDNVYEFCKRLFDFIGCRFSFDAEGKLRGGKLDGVKVGDKLNPDKVADYVANGLRAIEWIEKGVKLSIS